MNRRSFIKSTVASASALAIGTAAGAADDKGGTSGRAVFVPAGKDRFGDHLRLLDGAPLDGKVSAKDTNGRLYVFEHKEMGKGGPPRHLHPEQDVWFYVVKGEFAFEVGDERFTLKASDSVFAPKKVPHVWACVSETPGTLLLAVQPAGTTEAFFKALANFSKRPAKEELEKLFEAHGMKVVGAPLKVD